MYGGFPSSVKYSIMNWSPLAILQGIGFFFMGYMSKLLINIDKKRILYLFILFILFACLYFTLPLHSKYYECLRVVIWVINPFIAFSLVLFYRGKLSKSMVLRSIGSLSLPIYIFHQPINGFVNIIANKYLINEYLALIATYSIVLLSAYCVSVILSKTKLYGFLFPNDWIRIWRKEA